MDSILHEIRRDITDIKSRVEHTASAVDGVDKRLSKLASAFDAWKNGSPDGDRPGINVRVDRVERVQAVIIWGGSIVGGALLLAFVGAAIALFTRGHSG